MRHGMHLLGESSKELGGKALSQGEAALLSPRKEMIQIRKACPHCAGEAICSNALQLAFLPKEEIIRIASMTTVLVIVQDSRNP